MKKLNEIDGIVFDMDGVIFDSERLGLKVWQTLADKYGLGDISAVAAQCIGRSTADTMQILDSAYGSKVSIEKLYDESRIVLQEIIAEKGLPLKSGAREILEFLKAVGVKVGLASSTSYRGVVSNLKMSGLLDCFEVIVGGDMIEHSKPEPEIYLLACEKLGVNPEKTYAVEDSKNGIISAFRAKMMPILVPDMIEPTEEMLSMSAAKFDTLTDFMESVR